MLTDEPLRLGYTLDRRYRISKVLGQGGMGRVYLANDTRLADRPVAVKEMIVGDGLHEQKAIEDFLREREVLARLSHPGIPSLYDYLADNGRHYLVMEFVPGGDLQQLLDKLGPGRRLPEASVVRWSRDILEVLSFLHNQTPPIVYRDLKPGNIMIHQDGRAMLIDFGIARFLPPGGRGTQIGSVGYAPPEQYAGKVGPRSDLYSLAATIHHLLTGRDPQLEPPFSFPPVRALAPEVSAETERVLARALERDPDKRFTSAREMLRALPYAQTGEAEASATAPTAAGIVPTRDAPAVSTASRSGRVTGEAVASAGRPAAYSPAAPAEAGESAASSQPNQTVARPPGARAPDGRAAGAASGARDVSATAKTQDLKRPPARGSYPGKARPAGAPPAPNFAAGRAGTDQPSSLKMPHALLAAVGERQRFTLSAERVVMGRSGTVGAGEVYLDLSVLGSAANLVSRRHAEVIRLGADYFIRDLGSLNGTYIGGHGRLSRDQLYKLRHQDEIVLGGLKLRFQTEG
jgi:hypothetical protein